MCLFISRWRIFCIIRLTGMVKTGFWNWPTVFPVIIRIGRRCSVGGFEYGCPLEGEWIRNTPTVRHLADWAAGISEIDFFAECFFLRLYRRTIRIVLILAGNGTREL